MITKLASELKPGDRIEGYRFPYSLWAGTVKSVETEGKRTTITLLDGHFTVAANEPIELR